jgi:hypothetical protein
VIAVASADLLPERVAAWPELDVSDGAIGFRTADAVALAVSMWPGTDHVQVLQRMTAPDRAADPRGAGDAERTYRQIAETKGIHAAIAWWRVRQPTLPVPDDAATADRFEHWRWVASRRSATLEVGPGVLTVRWSTADAPKDPCGYGCRCCRHADTCTCPVCEQDRADADYCAALIADSDGAETAVVREFTSKSRGRMMRYVASVSWGELRQPGERLMMLTLTYPGHWQRWCPNPETAIAHLDALAKRFHRATGTPLRCVWVREFQRRGAPHFHLLCLFPTFIDGKLSKDWLSRVWYEIVGSGDERHLQAGTRIDYAKSLQGSLDPKRVAAYFAGYTAAGKDKGHQHEPPSGWRNDNGSVGAYWGRRGVTKATAEVAITPNEVIELKRLIRRMIRAQKRTAPRRVPRQTVVRYVDTTTGETITPAQWQTLDEPDKLAWHQVVGEPKRWRTVNRRWRLRSLTGQGPKADGERGFTVFANDAPLLATQLARCIHTTPAAWPKGQRRPLP